MQMDPTHVIECLVVLGHHDSVKDLSGTPCCFCYVCFSYSILISTDGQTF